MGNITSEDVGAGIGMMVNAYRRSQDKNLEAMMEAIGKNISNGAYDKAITQATLLINKRDKNQKILGYLFRGTTLANQEKWAEARDDYSEAIKLVEQIQEEGLEELYLYRAFCYLECNDFGSALRDSVKYVQMKPDDIQGHFAQGRVFQALEDYAQAHRSFSRAIEIDPSNVEGYRARANNSLLAHEYQEGLKDVSYAIKLSPKDTSLYKLRSNINEKFGDTSSASNDRQAIEELQKLNQRYKDYYKTADDLHNQGLVYYSNKNEYTMSLKSLVSILCISIFMMIFISLEKLHIVLAVILAIIIIISVSIIEYVNYKNRDKKHNKLSNKLDEIEKSKPRFTEFYKQYLLARQKSQLDSLPDSTEHIFTNS